MAFDLFFFFLWGRKNPTTTFIVKSLALCLLIGKNIVGLSWKAKSVRRKWIL